MLLSLIIVAYIIIPLYPYYTNNARHCGLDPQFLKKKAGKSQQHDDDVLCGCAGRFLTAFEMTVVTYK
ncbi:MAG: hypothetical protein FWH18_07230 [Marinilabiliaceae bacterium]|nr:hypothetical protein [Marinilabiliaceae bacterium]